MHRTLGIAAVLLVAAPALAAARATPGQACAASKETAVGRTLACRTKCDASAFKKGQPTDPDCIATCESRFSAKWTKIEAGGGCVTTGDESSLESKVEALRAILRAFAGTPPSKCAGIKLKEAGKKAACRLACHAKAKRKGVAVDSVCLGRCTSKFGKRCVGADDLGDCSAITNCSLVESAVDATVADVDAALPAETSTTTTTIPPNCGSDEPVCDGTCPPGQHCDATGLLSCACFPDGVTGCGTTTFPQCGGACPAGSQCQAVAVDGDFTFRECECVSSDSNCGVPQCSEPGLCPAGFFCGFFVVGSSPECACFPATTTTVVTTTTTTTTVPTPWGQLQFPQCNGSCPPGERLALLAGNLTFAGGIERSVANLDLTLSLVMADDQAIWRDAEPSQLERMRRRAVGEQLFAAAKHDRHREDAHSVDQVIGEQRVDEFGTALGDEVRAVFLLQALHVGDVAQEH